MDNPLITDFKEELKREGLNGDEIKQCIKILKDIYIGQNIYVGHGILRHDFYKFGTKPISLLLEHDYIEEVQWYSHHLYHTTEKGSKIGRIVVTNLIDEKKSELEGFLNKQPQKDLNFVIQEHIVKSKYEKFTYSVHARDLSVLESNNWIKPFIVDGRIHIAWTSVLFGLEVLGLCVRTNNYVSTRGGELREENYVISSEVFDFLVENCPEKSLTEEEYENCKLYDVLQYCYRYQERPLDVFRDTYWDRLRDVRLEEEKVKKAIDTMEEMGITSEYRGLLSSEAPFSIKDKSRYCIWLEKTLKEPIIESLLELSQGMSTEPPKLKVSANSYDFGDVKQGDTPSKTFTVENVGGGTLNWEVSDFPDWLDVTTIDGTNDGSFTVTVRSDASVGDCAGTVEVISNAGSEAIDVSVHIEIPTEPPKADFITFPTAIDENQTKNVLGRDQFSEKFVLGMDKKNEYISIPWNGKESHISMFCGTGTGKSTLASSIALQSIFQRIPVVIFDPKDGWAISLIKALNDIFNLLDDQKKKSISERFNLTNQSMNGFDFTKPIKFNLDGKEYGIKYNLFSFDENVLQKIPEAREYRTPVLNIPNVYPFPEKTEDENLNKFKDACDMVATSFVGALNLRGDAAYNSEIAYMLQEYYDSEKSFFTREEFIEILSGHDPKIIDKKDMKKLTQGVLRYCTANAKFIARDDKSVIPVNEIFNNPFIEENNVITISIFDIQSIGAMAEQDKTKIMTMYSSSVTGQIFDYINKKNPPAGTDYKIGMPKVWLIYDEVHNLIEEGKTTSNNNIKRIMQEGRSLGAFATIISQKPQNVDITARAQAKNRIYSEVSWSSISPDISAEKEERQEIKKKVSKSNKSTKMITLVNDEYPEGKLIYPLTSPQCILAKTDILSLL